MSQAQLSLRRHLMVMLISSILLIWLVVLVLVYRSAAHEVEEVFDRDLERSTRILQALLLHEVEEEREMGQRVREVVAELGNDIAHYPRLGEILQEYAEDTDQERLEMVGVAERTGEHYGKGLTFIARYADGSIMLQDRAAPDIPPTADGFTNLPIDGMAWRVYALGDRRSGFLVQAAEPLASRAELARYITRDTLAPMLLALPLLALLIWFIVGRALMPLQRIAREVSLREPNALDPIDDAHAPQEIQGLLRALNTLFDRLRSAIGRERQFTADAAHELRTPLAALKTNLQVANRQSTDEATRESLAGALGSVDRAIHSVEQLLALARADAKDGQLLVEVPVDLHELAAWAVAALSQQALVRDIDLGVGETTVALVRGDTVGLQMLIRNLVDNAIRYSAPGGTVTINVGTASGTRWIEVLDDGPGVPLAERQRIFDRFHRGPVERTMDTSGSGLGLSIVQRVARLHGAELSLGEGLAGRGLGVRVTFPATASG